MAARYCRVCASVVILFICIEHLGAVVALGGDDLAGGALRVDQSRALQLGKGALHGIRVGTGIGCKLAHRWKLAPGRIDAGNDLLLQARDELRIDGLIGLKFPGHEVTSCAAVLSD